VGAIRSPSVAQEWKREDTWERSLGLARSAAIHDQAAALIAGRDVLVQHADWTAHTANGPTITSGDRDEFVREASPYDADIRLLRVWFVAGSHEGNVPTIFVDLTCRSGSGDASTTLRVGELPQVEVGGVVETRERRPWHEHPWLLVAGGALLGAALTALAAILAG